MKPITENQAIGLCLLLTLVGAALRVPQILAGDWPTHHLQETTMEYAAFTAAMRRRLPEVPQPHPEIKKGNADIEAVAASAREAEDSNRMPRMDYGRAVTGGDR